MKKSLLLVCVIALLSGCAGGPTKDYYNPEITGGQKFKGEAVVNKVEDIKSETNKLISDGYTVIGRTDYLGKFPEAVELRAQAKRVHANRVIYSTVYHPPQPGSFNFSFGSWGGQGGSGGGAHDVKIVFLGK